MKLGSGLAKRPPSPSLSSKVAPSSPTIVAGKAVKKVVSHTAAKAGSKAPLPASAPPQQQVSSSSPATPEASAPSACPRSPTTTRIPAWSLYKNMETIGSGAFGIAYLVEPIRDAGEEGISSPTTTSFKGDGKRYVIKRMFMQGSNNDILRAAATEVGVLQMVEKHPNIINYHDHFVDDEGYINIVMEYCPGGDLEQLIRQRCGGGGGHPTSGSSSSAAENGGEANDGTNALIKAFSLEEILFIGFQLLCALKHLHACGVVHRDLKPANIFICASDAAVSRPRDGAVIIADSDDEDGGGQIITHNDRVTRIQQQTLVSVTGMTLKLADFGIAKVLETTQACAKTVIGTPFYISPQLCNDEPYSSGADVWALGCIIFEVAHGNGQKCFDGANMMAIVRKVCSGLVPHLPPHVDMLLRPMLLGMLCPEEAQRLTAAQVLHQFFYTTDTDFAEDFEDPEDEE